MPHLWPYQAIGQPHQPAIICLHGFMGGGADWLPLVKPWADRFYCLLPDLPGHGRHLSRSRAELLTFDRLADELSEFVEGLNLAQVGLLGYSLGGRLALYTVLKHPEKFSSLILESANPGLTDESERKERAAVDARRAEQILTGGMAAFVEAWYGLPLFHTLRRYPHLLKTIKSKRSANDPHWAAKIISELSPGRQPSLWSRLGELSLPVLLIAGELDPPYLTVTHQMAQAISRAAVKIIPEAGHNTHLEQPEQFSQACLQHWSETLA